MTANHQTPSPRPPTAHRGRFFPISPLFPPVPQEDDGGGARGARVLHRGVGAGAAAAGEGVGFGAAPERRAVPRPGLRGAARRLPALGEPLQGRNLSPFCFISGLPGARARLFQNPRRDVEEADGER